MNFTHRLLLIIGHWSQQAKTNYTIQPAQGQEKKTPEQLKGVSIEERFGAVVDHSFVFVDHNAQSHRLGDFFGDKPVILTLNYWRCKSLCTFQLGNLAETVPEVPWEIGQDYRIVTISFDSIDTPELASEARNTYLSKGNLPQDTDWTSLIGEQKAIDSVTNAPGFFYKHDKESNEFAHSAALFFFSTTGRLSRYLYGIPYSPLDYASVFDRSCGKKDQYILRLDSANVFPLQSYNGKVRWTCTEISQCDSVCDAFCACFMH